MSRSKVSRQVALDIYELVRDVAFFGVQPEDVFTNFSITHGLGLSKKSVDRKWVRFLEAMRWLGVPFDSVQVPGSRNAIVFRFGPTIQENAWEYINWILDEEYGPTRAARIATRKDAKARRKNPEDYEFYHGTTKQSAKKIRKTGLSYPFLASRPDQAMCWAEWRDETDAVVLGVDVPNKDLLVPDYNMMDSDDREYAIGIRHGDIREELGNNDELLIRGRGRLRRAAPSRRRSPAVDDYGHSARAIKDYDCGGEASIYLGHIPPKNIRRIKLQNPEDHLSRLIEMYGVTDDPAWGMFILPTGGFIKLYGDHYVAAISVMNDANLAEGAIKIIARFCRATKLLRWIPEGWAVECYSEPTPEQWRTLRWLSGEPDTALQIEGYRGAIEEAVSLHESGDDYFYGNMYTESAGSLLSRFRKFWARKPL